MTRPQQLTRQRRKATGRITRAYAVMSAFMRLGWQQAIAYPLVFAMSYLAVMLPAVIYFFVAKLVQDGGNRVGGDYYTFVIIGIFGVTILNAGLRSLGMEVQMAINRGWFEMILVEPVRWTLVPFGLVQWPIAKTLFGILLLVGVSVPLGAEFDLAGIPAAILITILGLLAGLTIGIVSTGLKVLAKAGDPLLTIYMLVAQVLSGTFFPLEVLPEWLRPVSWLIPHTHVISSLRRVLMPGGEAMPGLELGPTVLILVGFIVVFMPIALFLYGRGLEYGRQLGVLSGY